MEFSGKSAIVTGATRGIGRVVATELAARGARVVLVGRDQAALEAVAREVGGVAIAGDLADSSVAEQAVAAAREHFGRLDIVCNIAGIFPTAALEETSDALYQETLAANLTGTFHMCRAALPLLRESGAGAIVNMSSMAARFPTPGLSVYGASKAAVEAFTRAVAVEAAPLVRVNAVSAGPTLTEAVADLMARDRTGAVEAVTSALPLRRLAGPGEIGEAVLFLASARASFITGQVLHANGGGVMA